MWRCGVGQQPLFLICVIATEHVELSDCHSRTTTARCTDQTDEVTANSRRYRPNGHWQGYYWCACTQPYLASPWSSQRHTYAQATNVIASNQRG
jgi:hypothetical protein